MIEELAILGGPADLHDPRGDDRDLIVPHARVHAERTAHALERRCIAAGLRKEGKIIINSDIMNV